MRVSRPFTALAHKNFRLFWYGQIISLTGTWIHSVAQGWLVLKLTDSPFYLGLVGSAASMPILLFTLVGGVVADRFPKRKIILITQMVLMFFALTLAVMVSTGIVTVWYVLIIAFLIGAASAFDIPAKQSFFIEMVGRESLLNAIALNSAAFNGARVIGPPIAGILISHFSLAACFYVNALSFLALIIGLLKMRLEDPGIKHPRDTTIKEEFKEGLIYIIKEPRVHTLIIFVAIMSFFGIPYITFLPVYARDVLHIGATGLGILMSCAGVGAFIGAISLAVRGDFERKGVFLGIAGIIFSAALLVFFLSTHVWLSYATLFLIGWGAISQMATANTLIQLTTPDRLRGRVMSSFTLVFLGMTTLGNFALGSLAQYIGTKIALSIGAAVCLIIALLFVWKKHLLLHA